MKKIQKFHSFVRMENGLLAHNSVISILLPQNLFCMNKIQKGSKLPVLLMQTTKPYGLWVPFSPKNLSFMLSNVLTISFIPGLKFGSILTLTLTQRAKARIMSIGKGCGRYGSINFLNSGLGAVMIGPAHCSNLIGCPLWLTSFALLPVSSSNSTMP